MGNSRKRNTHKENIKLYVLETKKNFNINKYCVIDSESVMFLHYNRGIKVVFLIYSLPSCLKYQGRKWKLVRQLTVFPSTCAGSNNNDNDNFVSSCVDAMQ